jgi:hypothetical protein
MAGRTVRFCACLIALGLGAPGALAARVVDPATARRAIENPVVAAQETELTAFAANGRATDLAAALERISHDAVLVDVAQEWLLDRGLHALARLEPTRAARVTVVRLSFRAPAVFGIVDPDHGRRATPLYDAGATARFVLRSWDRDAARRKAASELAAGSIAPVARFASRGVSGAADPAREGIAEAFRAARPAEFAAQRAAIVDAIGAGRRVDELALVAAERLADRALYDLVVDYADEPVALAAVAGASSALDASSALAVLARASRRGEISSAAMLEIGRLARSDGAAQQFLLAALADPGTAPSAAAALGRLSEPAVSAEIGRRLAGAPDEPSRRLLVLALRLDPGPAARAELERFALSGAGSPQLQKEVRQWLGR